MEGHGWRSFQCETGMSWVVDPAIFNGAANGADFSGWHLGFAGMDNSNFYLGGIARY